MSLVRRKFLMRVAGFALGMALVPGHACRADQSHNHPKGNNHSSSAAHPKPTAQTKHHRLLGQKHGPSFQMPVTGQTRGRRLAELQAEKPENAFRPRYLLMGIIAAAAAGLWIKNQRDQHRHGQTSGVDGKGRIANLGAIGEANGPHQPRAVFINAAGDGPDPVTVSETGVHQRIVLRGSDVSDEAPAPSKFEQLYGGPTALLSFPPQALDSDGGPSSLAAPVSGDGGAEVDLRLPISTPLVGAQSKPQDQTLRLPAELSPHFTGLPQEKLVWSGSFSVPLVGAGTLAVTNQRFLALYGRHTVKLLPPKFSMQVRTYECALAHIANCQTVPQKRPIFLLVAALLCLWYPAGTILACLALGLYFGLPRQELGIQAGNVWRQYPLALPDQNDVMQALKKGARQVEWAKATEPGEKMRAG